MDPVTFAQLRRSATVPLDREAELMKYASAIRAHLMLDVCLGLPSRGDLVSKISGHRYGLGPARTCEAKVVLGQCGQVPCQVPGRLVTSIGKISNYLARISRKIVSA